MNPKAKLVFAGAMARARWPDVTEELIRVYVTDSPEKILLSRGVRPTLPRGFEEPCMDTQGPSVMPSLVHEQIPWYKIGFADGDWIGVGWDPKARTLLIVEPKE